MVAIIVISALSVLLALALLCWLRGDKVSSFLFPESYMDKGDKVHIYIDGQYNRTATINVVLGTYFVIYGCVEIPIQYRGQFYALAKDEENTFVYVKEKRYLKLVSLAEMVRKMLSVPDYDKQLPCDEEASKAMAEKKRELQEEEAERQKGARHEML